MKFIVEVLGFLVKLALFFLVVGVILGIVISEYAHAAEACFARCAA